MDQKNRWIILLDEQQQASTTMTTTARDSSSSSSFGNDSNTIGNITILPSPRNGSKRRYMFYHGRLLEIQRVTSPTPSSWFIDQSVKSDGSILVGSAMDPLFFLLPVLERNATRFSPLYQLLRGDTSYTPIASPPSNTVQLSSSITNDLAMDYTILLKLPNIYELATNICDDREGIDNGSDNRLYRLNKEKVLVWLSQKIHCTSQILQTKANSATEKARAAMNSFSSSSKLLETKENDVTIIDTDGSRSSNSNNSSNSSTGGSVVSPKVIEQEQLVVALSLVGEYITDEWIIKVSDHMGIPLDDIYPQLVSKKLSNPLSSSSSLSTNTTGSIADTHTQDNNSSNTGGSLSLSSNPSPTTAEEWNQTALNDPMDAIQRYLQGKGTLPSTPNNDESGKKRPSPSSAPQTIQQKRLAQTNTKGMKSMMGYFGKKE